MRLKNEKSYELESVFDFGKICNWDRKEIYCCNPEYELYIKNHEKAIDNWLNSKISQPKYPVSTIECEKCQYSNKELGVFVGNASDMVISRTLRGTIPVPLKGRKKIWLDNVNQKKLETALKEISPDIEELFISGSPGLSDLSFIEKYEKLKIIRLWWNNKADKLWDFKKTPNIEFLNLSDFNHISDILPLQAADKLRYLVITSETGALSTLKPLRMLSNLEYLKTYVKIADRDIRPIIALPKLKYYECQINIFDVEAYAMFEARRPDVDVNFFNGAQDDWDENDTSMWFAGKGQGFIESGEKAKYIKQMAKYAALKEKYKTEDFVPVLKAASKFSPIESWRQALAEGINLHTEKEIDEIERILTDYANRISAGISKGQVKNLLKETINKITVFNDDTSFIETEERQEIYDYLSSFFNQKWYDELEEILTECADW